LLKKGDCTALDKLSLEARGELLTHIYMTCDSPRTDKEIFGYTNHIVGVHRVLKKDVNKETVDQAIMWLKTCDLLERGGDGKYLQAEGKNLRDLEEALKKDGFKEEGMPLYGNPPFPEW